MYRNEMKMNTLLIEHEWILQTYRWVQEATFKTNDSILRNFKTGQTPIGWYKIRFIIMSTQNTEFILVLLYINYYIAFLWTIVNLCPPTLYMVLHIRTIVLLGRTGFSDLEESRDGLLKCRWHFIPWLQCCS